MRLHFETYGTGKPLVILHGLLGSGENWRTLSRRFAEQGRVLAMDLRNHGQSPHDEVFTYAAMAEDVQETMMAEGASPAVVMGHSLGGKVAMRLALTHSEAVEKLVVADMAPRAYAPHHLDLLDALQSLDLARITSRKEALDKLAVRIPDPGVRQFLLKNLAIVPEGGYQWQVNLDAIRRSYTEVITSISAEVPFEKPTLFIRGERSDYVRDGDWPEIQRLFPQAELVTIPAAGHWVHAEAPGPYYDAVAAFIGK